MASTFSQSGSTQNQFCSQGKGQLPAPSVGLKSVIPIVYSGNSFTGAAGDSGCIYLVPANSSNATINLPAPASTPYGTNFKFVFNASQTHTTAFTSATPSKIYGEAISPLANTAAFAYAGATTATAPSITTLTGDSAEFTTDQLNWYIFAQTQGTGAIIWT